MEKVRYKGSLVVMFVFIIMTGIFLQENPVNAAGNGTKKVIKANDNFKVETECGIDGFIAYDYPTVVKVTVESKSNFTGSIRILPQVDNGQKIVAYGEDISLAAGEAKTFIFTPASLGNLGEVNIDVLDEKDKLVYSESKQTTPVSAGANIIVGILSDDYSALNYFDGVSVTLNNYQGNVSTLELAKDSLPEDSGALSVLDYVVLDNFDTANLSKGQYKAIKEWVNNGGVLILSLGANYQNVLHCFTDDFITGTLGTLEKRDLKQLFFSSEAAQDNSIDEKDTAGKSESEKDNGENKQLENGMSMHKADVIDFAFDGAEEMSDFSQNKTAFKKEIGAGAVVILSYSLCMEPIAGYEDNRIIASGLIRASAVSSTSNKLNGVSHRINKLYSGTNLARLVDVNKKPSALLYGGILMIYVVFAGPILYLILKALKKREKIWVAIPIVSLVFTGGIYLTGFLYRINKPLVNTFSIITLDNEIKTENVYTNITCPKAQSYTVKLKKGYSDFGYNVDDYSYNIFSGGSSDKQFDYMLRKKNDGTEVILNNDETFERSAFALSKSSENDIGTIDYDLKCYTTGFEGTLTNNTVYDLTNVVVNFESYFYRAGDIKKGEQVTIDADKIIESVGYGVFEKVYQGMPDIYSDKKLYMQYQIDTTMENSFADVKSYKQGCIWAGIGSYKPDMIRGTEVKQSGNGVLFKKFTEEYEDVKSVYYPNLDQMILSSQGEYDRTDGMLYGEDVAITYSFENCPGITTLENLSYNKEVPDNMNGYHQKEYAKVYAYNPETGEYDLIFADSSVLSGDELKKYFSGNVIMLKYEAADTSSGSYMPRIIARGDE